MSISRIVLTQGDSKSIPVRVFKNHEKLDIEGYLFSFTVKKKLSDTDADALILIDWSDHVDAENGLTLIEILPGHTKNIDAGSYYCDLQFVSNGDVTTLFTGEFVVKHEVTRR